MPDGGRRRGTGRVWFQRCPSALWEPWLGPLLASLADLEEGWLPAPGTMSEQSAAWREAVRIARPHYQRCRRRVAEKARER